jgi:transcriptional regulator with XRE-family HTH domain
MTYHFKNIGDRIFEIRKLQGVSRKKLAGKAGLSIKTLDLIEWYGNDCHISTLFKISEALKIDIKELFI